MFQSILMLNPIAIGFNAKTLMYLKVLALVVQHLFAPKNTMSYTLMRIKVLKYYILLRIKVLFTILCYYHFICFYGG